jgi:hypothetical protein
MGYAYFCSTGEPYSTAEAFQDSRWKATMDEEYDALIKNGMWHLVPSAHGQNVIDCKWVYEVKRKADGTVDCYKACLLQKALSNDMALTMRTHLVMLLKQLLFMWFCRCYFLWIESSLVRCEEHVSAWCSIRRNLYATTS